MSIVSPTLPSRVEGIAQEPTRRGIAAVDARHTRGRLLHAAHAAPLPTRACLVLRPKSENNCSLTITTSENDRVTSWDRLLARSAAPMMMKSLAYASTPLSNRW